MDAKRIDKETLAERIGEKNLTIIDVRANWAASEQKIPGAVHESVDRVSDWSGRYDPSQPTVVYCSAPKEADSRTAAEALAEAGFEDVSVLSGGWWVWKTTGLPTERREKQPLPKGVVPGAGKP
jgi:rhodanese-related sulfurtransferase